MWFLCGSQLVAVIQSNSVWSVLTLVWNVAVFALHYWHRFDCAVYLFAPNSPYTVSAGISSNKYMCVVWHLCDSLDCDWSKNSLGSLVISSVVSFPFPLVLEHLWSVVIKSWDECKFFTQVKTKFCCYWHPLVFLLTLHAVTLRSVWTQNNSTKQWCWV